MAVIGEILFYKGDLDATLQRRITLLAAAVDNISAQTFNAKSDEEIATLVLKDFSVEPLTLYVDQAEAKVEEGQAEVRDHFRYNLPNGPMKVPGLKASKWIPFSGDPHPEQRDVYRQTGLEPAAVHQGSRYRQAAGASQSGIRMGVPGGARTSVHRG